MGRFSAYAKASAKLGGAPILLAHHRFAPPAALKIFLRAICAANLSIFRLVSDQEEKREEEGLTVKYDPFIESQLASRAKCVTAEGRSPCRGDVQENVISNMMNYESADFCYCCRESHSVQECCVESVWQLKGFAEPILGGT